MKTMSFGAIALCIRSQSTSTCKGSSCPSRIRALFALRGPLPMFRSKQPQFSVTISRGVLESIFNECDLYDSHETGGKLIGTYQKKGVRYDIQLSGVLGPGPNATRSATSLFQDGDYQEQVFRSIEERHPEIEHLGSWHTHHVNGLATLSQG